MLKVIQKNVSCSTFKKNLALRSLLMSVLVGGISVVFSKKNFNPFSAGLMSVLAAADGTEECEGWRVCLALKLFSQRSVFQ